MSGWGCAHSVVNLVLSGGDVGDAGRRQLPASVLPPVDIEESRPMFELVVSIGSSQLNDTRDQNRVAPGCGVEVGDLERGERNSTGTIGCEVLVTVVQSPAGVASAVVFGAYPAADSAAMASSSGRCEPMRMCLDGPPTRLSCRPRFPLTLYAFPPEPNRMPHPP